MEGIGIFFVNMPITSILKEYNFNLEGITQKFVNKWQNSYNFGRNRFYNFRNIRKNFLSKKIIFFKIINVYFYQNLGIKRTGGLAR